MIKGLVIAGNYNQFRRSCEVRRVNHRDYKYMLTEQDIRGRCDTTLFLIGTYWEATLFGEYSLIITDYCEQRNIRISYDFPN